MKTVEINISDQEQENSRAQVGVYRTIKDFLSVATPAIISRLSLQTNIICVAVASRLENRAQLAGMGLAFAMQSICAIYFMVGFLVPLETLTTQAFGAGNLAKCGVYLNRALILTHIAIIPIFTLLLNQRSILKYFDQDE